MTKFMSGNNVGKKKDFDYKLLLPDLGLHLNKLFSKTASMTLKQNKDPPTDDKLIRQPLGLSQKTIFTST